MKFRELLAILYRSPLGYLMSVIARGLTIFKNPYMIYGFRDPSSSQFHKYTRISDSAVIWNRSKLSIDNYVWVSHYCILDATEGLMIEEGCQLSAWVGIFTHGSQVAIRLHGKEYVNIPHQERIGYSRGSVTIGAYSFIGAGAIILPSVKVGKGCVIGAGSVVTKDIPNYSIAWGIPAKVVGSTKALDKKFLHDINLQKTYYDQDVLAEINQELLKEKP